MAQRRRKPANNRCCHSSTFLGCWRDKGNMASSTNNGDSSSTYEQQKQEKKEASMKRLIEVTEPEVEVRRFATGSFGGSLQMAPSR